MKRSDARRRGAFRPRAGLRALLLCLVLAASLWPFGLGPGTAAAHFNLDANIRIFHVEHLPPGEGLRLFIRQPLPYLLADKLLLDDNGAVLQEAPYSRSAEEGGRLVHYLDIDALRARPEALARLIAEGYALRINGVEAAPVPGRMRLHPALDQPPFALLEEAQTALDGPLFDPFYGDAYIGEVIVDMELLYPAEKAAESYALRSLLDPGLDGQGNTANIIIDHGGEKELVLRARGLMAEAVEVSRSRLQAAATFAWQGMLHILAGWDHLLFVLCLLLGAQRLPALCWRVTGFTIGHSITLSLGFLGYAPAGAWFVPLVETGIALSIIYAAIVALMNSLSEPRGMLLTTSLLGLLHGLGFSFVLESLLRLESPHLWESLAGFNLGVEAGQLLVVLAVWPLLRWLCGRLGEQAETLRWALAGPCVLVAAYWSGERFLSLLAAI